TAYHEAGHTIIGVKKEPETDPVYKVSIMPRGKGLGVTISIPEGDQISMSQNEAEAVMAMMMGGRQAEAITFGDKTTGASNDIERATALARAAVYQYGWSALGPINLMPSQEYGYSADLLDKAEVEVKKFLDKSVEEATKVILDNTDAYKRIAEGLIEFETIDRNEVDLLIGGDDAFEKIRRARAALEEETPSVSTPPQSEIRAASPTIN
ncbi:MAG TPA: cell division protein FtsH, partial [Micavibrio sp.]